MKKKTGTKSGKTSVTFELPADIMATGAVVVGDFNGWQSGTPMKRRRDGSLSATLRLGPGRYHYRYLLDGERWENDWQADSYVPNEFGGDDSVIDLTTIDLTTPEPAPAAPPKAKRARKATKKT